MGNAPVAMVTGAAVRVGRCIATALADAGYDVVIHCRNSTTEAAQLRRLLQSRGRQAWVVRGRLDSEAAIRKLWRAAVRAAGPIDALVNSAARFEASTARTVTGAGLLGEFWPNLFAPMLLTRLLAEQQRPSGQVINLLDRRVAAHDPAHLIYHVGKQALAEFTVSAALGLAPRIRVNAVAPGPILPPPGRTAAHLRAHGGPVPLARRVTPDDVAAAVLGLLRWPAVTGQTIFVDGGQHLLGSFDWKGPAHG